MNNRRNVFDPDFEPYDSITAGSFYRLAMSRSWPLQSVASSAGTANGDNPNSIALIKGSRITANDQPQVLPHRGDAQDRPKREVSGRPL
jgi:hypothetical protein